MSGDTSHHGSESNQSLHTASAGESGSSTKHHQASPSSANSEGATTPSENQGVVPGFSFPFLARVSKGRLNVSEASVPPPTSSAISASGEVFIPAHDHPSEWENKRFHPSELGTEETAPKVENAGTGSEPLTPQNTPVGTSRESKNLQRMNGDEGAPPLEHDQKSSDQPQPNIFGEIIDSIPEIRITRPSTPTVVMATALGTSVVAPTAAIVPANILPLQPESMSSALPVGDLTSASPLPLPSPLSARAAGGKQKTKVRKLIGLVRKHLLRKRLLALVLGRPVANLVHPLLSQSGNLAASLPLPVDGASDSQENHTRRQERKRIAQQQRLANRIKDAKQYADAEKSKRCQICTGFTQSKYLRRYHRLLLKKDRPDMRMLERHATAVARATAFRCTCGRRIP